MDLPIPAVKAMGMLQTRLDHEDCPCVGMIADRQLHFDLRMPQHERHLWSPALGGNFEVSGEDSSILHGLIGPNPSAWTAIAFSYLACGTGILFLLTLGGVQLFLGKSPWAFWATLILVLFMVVAWVVSQLGQRVAAPQVKILRGFLEDTFLFSAEEHRRTEENPYRD
ncbi:MAG: hypothetical protein ACYSU1_01185 [Planctomycetota bacterium]|jgi:hypothetical protein